MTSRARAAEIVREFIIMPVFVREQLIAKIASALDAAVEEVTRRPPPDLELAKRARECREAQKALDQSPSFATATRSLAADTALDAAVEERLNPKENP